MNRHDEVDELENVFCQLSDVKKIAMAIQLRDVAVKHLGEVVKRFKKHMPRNGWNLNNPDHAVVFSLLANNDNNLTLSQKNAVRLLYFSTKAIEENIVSDNIGRHIFHAWRGLDSDSIQIGNTYRAKQSKVAKNPRPRIALNGEKFSIAEIIKPLAMKKDALGDYLSSNELWPLVFSELDMLCLSPAEVDTEDKITYTKMIDNSGNPIQDEFKYSSFKTMLSNIRKS